MSRIENWTMSREEIAEALKLQGMIKDAGLTWPQLDKLLGMRHGTVCEYCRGHVRVQPQVMNQIRDILDKVKAGKIEPPIVWEEE